MNLFSDNKRIIKNNFQIMVFPSTTVVPQKETKEIIIEQVSVDLCEVYYEQDTTIVEETNPMIKSK